MILLNSKTEYDLLFRPFIAENPCLYFRCVSVIVITYLCQSLLTLRLLHERDIAVLTSHSTENGVIQK